MNKLTNWLQVVGHFGILVGLVLVLLQMSQNESLQRVQILNQFADTTAATEMMLAGDRVPEVWAKAILEPQNLTLAEYRVMETQIWPSVLRWVNLYRMYEAGILKDEDWRREVDTDAGFVFGTAWAQGWWANSGTFILNNGYLPPDLHAAVQARIDASPDSNPLLDYQFIISRMRERFPGNGSDTAAP